MFATMEGWIERYKQREALWIGDLDDPSDRPHALLTWGEHTIGFFNSKLVTADPSLLLEAADDLLALLVADGLNLFTVDRVVGPRAGATELAKALHLAINRVGGHCTWASPAKRGDGPHKKMWFDPIELGRMGGERILTCDDVLVTGGSIEMAVQPIIEMGGIILPQAAVLVNRSGKKEVGGRTVTALIDRYLPNWEPEECPRCQRGSVAIRPRQPLENWARLTGIC